MRYLLAIALLGLSGCSQYQQWDRTHERTYGVSYNADSQTGAVSMTIRPAAASSALPVPADGMTDAVIAKIVRTIYEEAAKQQAAGILDTPDLSTHGQDAHATVVSTLAGGTPALR